MGRLGSWMQPHIERLGQQVEQGVGQVGQSVTSLRESVAPALTNLGEQVGSQVSNLGDQVRPAIDNLGEQVAPVIRDMGAQVGGLVDGLVDTVMLRSQLERSDMVIRRQEGDLSGPPDSGPGLLGHIGDLAGQLGDQIGRLNPLGGRGRHNWWEGPGVCTEREVITQEQTQDRGDGNTREFGVLTMNMEESVCTEEGNVYQCRTGIQEGGVRKIVVVRYLCCHGYRRMEDRDGCVQVRMKPLEQTIREQGGREFLTMLEEADLMGRLKGNLTVFVPSDAAVEQFHRQLIDFNSLDSGSGVAYTVDKGLSYGYKRRKRDLIISEAPNMEDTMMAHFTRGFVSVQQMQERSLLDTESSAGAKIRTTVYTRRSDKVVMANCARLTARDILATNGIVHVVDKMVQPATHTIGEILESDFGFSQFASALKVSSMMDPLLANSANFTVFAPTNEAMDRLESTVKEQLRSGFGCAGSILMNHILPNVLCSGIVEGKARTNNMLGDLMLLERNAKNTISVDGVELMITDMVAINGVIHVIDEVLIPSAAQTVADAMTSLKMTTLLDLIDMAKLTDVMEDLTNVTLFLPSERAMNELPASFLTSLKEEPDTLKEFVMTHVAKPITNPGKLSDNLLLETEATDQQIRINKFSRTSTLFGDSEVTVTAQCATIHQTHREEFCGGLVYAVDRVLLPTPGNIVQVVTNIPSLSRFLELIQFSGLISELDTEPEDGRTLLAPTNAAFDKLDPRITAKLASDKNFAQKVVQKHILEEILCCSGIQKNNIFFNTSRRRSSAGQVSVRRTTSGHLYADKAEITKCDLMASNGVVLQLESLLT